jgi:hypothetical protein
VTMQNHTNHRSEPAVRRRSVSPKDILDNVDAKQDIDATTETPRAMVGWFAKGMSIVRLPKPRWTPTWVVMASARRSIYVANPC